MAIWSTYLLFGLLALLFGYGIYTVFSSEANPVHASHLINIRASPVNIPEPRPSNFALEDTINNMPEPAQLTPPPPPEPTPELTEEIADSSNDEEGDEEGDVEGEDPPSKTIDTESILDDIDKKWHMKGEEASSSLEAETGQLVSNSDFSEFHERLTREGAQTGQVQVSLIWNNINDLDLSVICPSGERISFDNNVSKCGGQLDVDMNELPTTDKPVENVFWPVSLAPKGEYKVIIEHFEQHDEENLTPYRVLINDGFEHREYCGEITNDEPPRIVCVFSVG